MCRLAGLRLAAFVFAGAVIIPVSLSINLDERPTNTISNAGKFGFFDVELIQKLAMPNDGNILISPASIKQVLLMLVEGAQGETASQIVRALRLDKDIGTTREFFRSLIHDLNNNHDGSNVQLANRVFVSKKLRLNSNYRQVLRNYYDADLEEVDFQRQAETVNTVNNWVNTATRGFIPDLVRSDSLPPESTLMVANALYFKGIWDKSFNEQTTAVRCFRTIDSNCKQYTYMMDTMDTFKYGDITDLNAQALELPYQDGKYSMLILLPNKVEYEDNLLNDLHFVRIPQILEQMESTEVTVSLPRFQIEQSSDLVNVLQEFGIKHLFNLNANLSGIASDYSGVKVSSILHKTKIIVNERGTTAAAATGAVVIPLMGSTKPRFRADHPFLFFIRHMQRNTILFAGRVSEPEIAPNPESNRNERKPSGQSSSNFQNNYKSSDQGGRQTNYGLQQFDTQPQPQPNYNSFSQQPQTNYNSNNQQPIHRTQQTQSRGVFQQNFGSQPQESSLKSLSRVESSGSSLPRDKIHFDNHN